MNLFDLECDYSSSLRITHNASPVVYDLTQLFPNECADVIEQLARTSRSAAVAPRPVGVYHDSLDHLTAKAMQKNGVIVSTRLDNSMLHRLVSAAQKAAA